MMQAATVGGQILNNAIAIGQIASSVAVALVLWRAAGQVGAMTKSQEIQEKEMDALRVTRDEHIALLSRVVTLVDGLERRVHDLEVGRRKPT